ncbi:dolichyl-phosphate beta-glucosyltransferase-like [Halichondria panicea]|uniref:dolichyl-phosphate beta-glucosyltransferase-like n=1 Tax=Halichondria panicea TaxID=6063 RepID=UPI00312B9915
MSSLCDDLHQWLNVNLSLSTVLILLGGFAVCAFLVLYIFLWTTTLRDPPVQRSKSESVFRDPVSNQTHMFPLTVATSPTLYLSLVAPAYKEQDRLPKMLGETMEYLENRQKSDPSFTYEVVVVNDGSPDNTSQEAINFVQQYGCDKIRLLELDKNRGKGGAVRMGCLSVRGERVLFLDADAATDIKDVARLEKALDALTTDHSVPALAIGSRAHLQEEATAQRSFFRNILTYGFHLAVYVLCVKGVKDTQCGFKMLTRSAASTLFQLMHIDRWAFDVELLYIAQQLKMPIKEVAVNWQEIEGSKLVPLWSWLQMGRDLLFIRLRYTFGLWTLKLPKSKSS